MKYALALVVPPLAMLLSGRPIQAVLCGILFLSSLIAIPFGIGIFGWVLCSAWAVVLVATTNAAKANLETMRSLEQRPDPQPRTEST
jgi:hypothetical protein